MTSPGGVEAAQTRAWETGDRAWLTRRCWFRGDDGVWRTDNLLGPRYTDAEMTAAGAQLVATADGVVRCDRCHACGLMRDQHPSPPGLGQCCFREADGTLAHPWGDRG